MSVYFSVMGNECTFQLFPAACLNAHVRERDLQHLESISMRTVLDATHIALLRSSEQMKAIATIKCFDDDMLLTFLEVTKPCRGDGNGARLLEALFNHASEVARQKNGRVLVLSDGFTEAGKKYLLPHLIALDDKHENVSYSGYSIG